MRLSILIASIILTGQFLSAQSLVTKNGLVRIYSHTPVEDIEAENQQAVSILDTLTGKLQFMLLVKSFAFEKKLMEEHFNENYMESDKYPKASFEGSITNLKEINFGRKGSYNAQVTGKLTIRGVTRDIKVGGTIIVLDNQINAKSVFMVKPEDYGITIPAVVRGNIAREIEISVNSIYLSK